MCIENAQGRAGDVVDVDVVLLSNPTCGAAGEASGHVVFDVTKLHVENEIDRIDCRLRLLGPDVDGKTDLAWQAFGGGSFPGCVADVPAGKVDTIEIEIAAGTPPGDYPLTWSNAGFIGHMNAPVDCTTIGQEIAGTLRVLP